MAILTDPWLDGMYDPTYQSNHIKTTDLAIGGKIVQARFDLPDIDLMKVGSDQTFRDEIKRRLVTELVQYLLANKFVECTTMRMVESGRTSVAARLCVTPDEQVRLLRVHGVDK